VRRWSWIKDSASWTALEAWAQAQVRIHDEIVGTLDWLLVHGPTGSRCLVEDVYVIYSWHFWVVVGDALPGRRRVLALDWGLGSFTKAKCNLTKAIEMLKTWREAQ
jgi:hypothetical protein